VDQHEDDEQTRSEQALERRAARRGWLRDEAERRKIAGRLMRAVEGDSDRYAILAARALMSGDQKEQELQLRAEALDLARRRLEGDTSEVSLAELVAEAERRAEERRRERDGGE
jgi:hypothetical protein